MNHQSRPEPARSAATGLETAKGRLTAVRPARNQTATYRALVRAHTAGRDLEYDIDHLLALTGAHTVNAGGSPSGIRHVLRECVMQLCGELIERADSDDPAYRTLTTVAAGSLRQLPTLLEVAVSAAAYRLAHVKPTGPRLQSLLEQTPGNLHVIVNGARDWVNTLWRAATACHRDKAALTNEFGIAGQLSDVRAVGDPHDSGSSVALARFTCGNSAYWKPRPARAEAVTELINELRHAGITCTLSIPRVLAGSGYHWSAPVARPPANHRAIRELPGHAYGAGRDAAIVWMLAGADLHHENVIHVDGTTWVLDDETLPSPQQVAYERIPSHLTAAVCFLNRAPAATGIFPRSLQWESDGADISAFGRSLQHMLAGSKCRPRENERLTRLGLDSFGHGYRDALHQLATLQPQQMDDILAHLTATDPGARVVARRSQVYVASLAAAMADEQVSTSDELATAIEARLSQLAPLTRWLGTLARGESAVLLACRIPRYSARFDSRRITDANGHDCGPLVNSASDEVRERHRLTVDNHAYLSVQVSSQVWCAANNGDLIPRSRQERGAARAAPVTGREAARNALALLAAYKHPSMALWPDVGHDPIRGWHVRLIDDSIQHGTRGILVCLLRIAAIGNDPDLAGYAKPLARATTHQFLAEAAKHGRSAMSMEQKLIEELWVLWELRLSGAAPQAGVGDVTAHVLETLARKLPHVRDRIPSPLPQQLFLALSRKLAENLRLPQTADVITAHANLIAHDHTLTAIDMRSHAHHAATVAEESARERARARDLVRRGCHGPDPSRVSHLNGLIRFGVASGLTGFAYERLRTSPAYHLPPFASPAVGDHSSPADHKGR